MTKQELNRIRDLAREQRDLATSPEMKELGKAWKRLIDCKGQQPLVTVETNTFAEEIIPPLMQCESEDARKWEDMLLRNIVNRKLFGDDTFVRDFIPVNYESFFTPFDLPYQREQTKGVGHRFVPLIEDLEEDFDKLKPSAMGLKPKEEAEKAIALVNDVLDGILPGKLVGQSNYVVLTQNIIHLMGMENMYLAMCDVPELFVKMIDNLAEDYLKYFDLLEKEGYLLPTVDSEPLGQGTYCFTDDLPKENITSTKQIWGFMDSQETTGISPDMYEELVFPAYQKVFSRYGALSYGCCEAVHPIWERCLSKIPNLRRISISPWCDEEYMGERLRGTKIVYHRKPSPNFLGLHGELDEPAIREHIRKTLNAAKGCSVEFTQRDVYKVDNSPEKVRRYVQILKEEIADHPV